MTVRIIISVLGILLAFGQVAAVTVTSPTTADVIEAAEDYATRMFQDPIDMDKETDLGFFTYDTVTGSKSNLTSISLSGGIFTGTANTKDPQVTVLESGQTGTCFFGKIGTNYKIDADKYKMFVCRMKLSKASAGYFFWSKNTIYNDQATSVDYFNTHAEWFYYVINIPDLGWKKSGTKGYSYSGDVDSFRFDPMGGPGTVGTTVQIDWIRLVELDSSLYRTITWTGNTGNVEIYLDKDRSSSNGTLGKIATNLSGSSYKFYVGGLAPGVYYVGIKNSSGGAIAYSNGYYRVNDIPYMTFTSPSPEGGDDFATVELGNAWDMTSTSDLDKYQYLSGAPSIVTMGAVNRAGESLGNIKLLRGRNTAGIADPITYPLWFDGGRGATTKIDASKYRIMVLKMGLPGAWDPVGGSEARVFWHVEGEFNGSIEKMHQSADIIIRHTNEGSKVMIDTIIADMNDVTLEQSATTTGWKGMIDGFRVDPHEFSSSKYFYIDEVKLAAFERANEEYTFRWDYTDSYATSSSLSLYYDNNDSGFNGTLIAANINPASGSYTWDTSGVPAGTYYVFSYFNDGINTNQVYAPWPIVVDHTVVQDPAISLSTGSLSFTGSGSKTFNVSNSGDGNLNWSVSDNKSWISVSPTSGTNSGTVTVTVNKSGLAAGTYNGTVTVSSTNASNSPQTVAVSLTVSQSSGDPTISLNRTSLNFGATSGSTLTTSETLTVNNSGTGTLNFTASDNMSWLSLSPTSGSGGTTVTVTANKSGLSVGTYSGTITITDPDATNSPQTVPVTLRIYNAGSTGSPQGTFDTPTDGATVAGSIPLTGWVVDDVEVVRVDIYSGSTKIDTALFVDGARPDVEAAFPNHPKNYLAGWGYMMLTNYLPGGGQGWYTLYAKAVDAEGHTVTLGSKRIYVDNDGAVKPFGAIDTPTQGGTASGSGYVNWAWALTPPPSMIPSNGSTLKVFVDGKNVGQPTYGIHRGDIESFFPGYANASAASGYFVLDTTAYENGVYTIEWNATDNNGNSDGIGSRFFTIRNSSNRAAARTNENGNGDGKIDGINRYMKKRFPAMTAEQLVNIPVDRYVPVHVLKGYNETIPPDAVYPDETGTRVINSKELQRLVIHLDDVQLPEGQMQGKNFHGEPLLKQYRGYLRVGNELRPLPAGSVLDTARGIFYWGPGPGFAGPYDFVFMDGEKQLNIQINITAKF